MPIFFFWGLEKLKRKKRGKLLQVLEFLFSLKFRVLIIHFLKILVEFVKLNLDLSFQI